MSQASRVDDEGDVIPDFFLIASTNISDMQEYDSREKILQVCQPISNLKYTIVLSKFGHP